MSRRYDDQMMLIDRRRVCDELRTIADTLDMSHAELLRVIVSEALPGLRQRAAATRRERTKRERNAAPALAA